VLAGYYAKLMGLPVGRLIVASNANNVLTDFIETGTYNRLRPFHKTISPSMDILVSSNLERLLYYLSGGDCEEVASYMADLATSGSYTVSDKVLKGLQESFACGYADDDATRATIRACWEKENVLIDTHTAVAKTVLDAREMEGRERVCLSTASPYKFSKDVLEALGQSSEGLDGFACMDALEALTMTHAPAPLRTLRTAPERHTDVCDRDKMQAFVLSACARIFL
jgi:threonine synthase